MRYYNCSDLSPRTNRLARYEDECPYPQLFDGVLNACRRWDTANCGPDRVIQTAPCDYLKIKSCVGDHCQPCEATYPSCVGVADGYHEYPLKLWSRYYTNCYYNRTEFLTCPTLPSGLPGYFSPLKKTCVSIYEVPTSTGFGKAPSCDGKEARFYSVPERPIVYYSCPSAQVYYCNYLHVFSDAIQSCL
ncbi:uncharacterized protein LOC131938947 [Physella acuta]|uniref:uncharacterized protein LOC131938947 n=1 Tax=Physella acuta TaxID=109671 RepID=UPI0027DDC36F|nr:uncharacterized protein LOC131938947 [Physella acuta]